jgi:hypothetical protein
MVSLLSEHISAWVQCLAEAGIVKQAADRLLEGGNLRPGAANHTRL